MDTLLVKLLAGWLVSVLSVQLVMSSDKFKEQTAIEGTSYKMKCADLSKYNLSRPFIIWAINGQPPRGQKFKTLTDGLVIRNVSKEDALANYTCTILDRSTFVPVHADSVKLKLRQRSGKHIEHQSYISSTMGNKVKIWGVLKQWKTLQCNMFSRPSPQFEWKTERTGDLIHNKTGIYQIIESETTSNLTIFIANETLFGEYICKGVNPLGESSQHFVLDKGYRPKFPFIFPTFIGSDKITVKVEPQEDTSRVDALPITNYNIQIRMGTLPETGSSTEHDTDMEWQTFSKRVDDVDTHPLIIRHNKDVFELQPLRENTTYLVRAAISNSAAMSDYSPVVRVTTDIVSRVPGDLANADALSEESESASGGPSDDGSRMDYGRSAGDVFLRVKNSSINSNETCIQPRFRKTLITTTISTILIEDMLNTEGNSSIVKKRVVEDTTVDRMVVCTIN